VGLLVSRIVPKIRSPKFGVSSILSISHNHDNTAPAFSRDPTGGSPRDLKISAGGELSYLPFVC
jgi:hypothetical protein